MKRLFSILLLSGMLMAPTVSYSNQYKDFAVGALKGISNALVVTDILSYCFKKDCLPFPVAAGGWATGLYLWLIGEGITSKNNTEKNGHLAGTIASIASIVAWCLYKK